MAEVKMSMPSEAPMKPLASMITSNGWLLRRSIGGMPKTCMRIWLSRPRSFGIDHPEPQQRIDDGRAHPRQQPHRAEEGAEPLRHGSGHQRQQQREADVEDPQRREDEDQR